MFSHESQSNNPKHVIEASCCQCDASVSAIAAARRTHLRCCTAFSRVGLYLADATMASSPVPPSPKTPSTAGIAFWRARKRRRSGPVCCQSFPHTHLRPAPASNGAKHHSTLNRSLSSSRPWPRQRSKQGTQPRRPCLISAARPPSSRRSRTSRQAAGHQGPHYCCQLECALCQYADPVFLPCRRACQQKQKVDYMRLPTPVRYEDSQREAISELLLCAGEAVCSLSMRSADCAAAVTLRATHPSCCCS